MYNFNEKDQIEVLKWFCIAVHISEGGMYVNCRLCGCSSTPCYQCFNGAEKWSVIEVVSQLVDTSLQQWFKQAVNMVGGIFTPGPLFCCYSGPGVLSHWAVLTAWCRSFLSIATLQCDILSGALVEIYQQIFHLSFLKKYFLWDTISAFELLK